MKRTISFAFIFLQILIFVNATGFYTIVAPGTIQSNYEYTVSVTLHGGSEPATIAIGINGTKYKETKTVDVSPCDTQVVHFDVPKIDEGEYKLETEGLKGLLFKNSTDLVYKDEKPKIYIQTDKAVYKPGDLVQYRILALDENTRPAKLEEPLNVGIRDGAGNHIKQLNNIKLTKGVYTGEFQLSEQPVLGNWVIDVTYGLENKPKTDKKFEVAKYVLPKFSVDIETAKDVSILDGVIKVTVRSKYTYGKPVKGKATVTIAASQRTEAAEKTVDVDGKGHLEFDLAKDLKFDQSQFDSIAKDQYRFVGYLPPLQVLAVVTEGFTGNKQNKTTSVNLEPSRYRITVSENIQEYTINKPFEIKAIIQKLDGSPVRDAKSKAKLTITQQSYYFGRPQGNEKKADLVYESDVKDDGMVTFTATIPNGGYYGDVTITFEEKTHYLPGLREKQATTAVDQGEEAVGPLKVVAKTEKHRLGQDVVFEVKSDKPIPYFLYAITGRGKMLKHERVALAENVQSHSVSFKPTFDMVPMAKIYVYFVKDGELRFAETTINFADEFENKIEITAPEQAKPSEEVTLNIKADPDSFIGLLGVDQSVLLLQSGNDLDGKNIRGDLNAYDTRTPYVRGYGEYPGRVSGLVTMTNANYPYNTAFYHCDQSKRRLYASPRGPGFNVFASPASAPGPLPTTRPGNPVAPPPMPNVQEPQREEEWYFTDYDYTTIPDDVGTVEIVFDISEGATIQNIKIRNDFQETWIYNSDISSLPNWSSNTDIPSSCSPVAN